MKTKTVLHVVIIALVVLTVLPMSVAADMRQLVIDVRAVDGSLGGGQWVLFGRECRLSIGGNMLEPDEYTKLAQSTITYWFGDGTSATYLPGQEARHTWPAPGAYTVATHIVMPDGETRDISQTVGFYLTKQVPGFVMNATSAANDQMVVFDGNRIGVPGARIAFLVAWNTWMEQTGASSGNPAYISYLGAEVPNLGIASDGSSGHGNTFEVIPHPQISPGFNYQGVAQLAFVVHAPSGSGGFVSFRCDRATVYYLPAPVGASDGDIRIRLPFVVGGKGIGIVRPRN